MWVKLALQLAFATTSGGHEGDGSDSYDVRGGSERGGGVRLGFGGDGGGGFQLRQVGVERGKRFKLGFALWEWGRRRRCVYKFECYWQNYSGNFPPVTHVVTDSETLCCGSKHVENGESKGVSSERGKHDEVSSFAGGRDKGESAGGLEPGVTEASNGMREDKHDKGEDGWKVFYSRRF
ncbi:hypothetical protein PIB30_074734 [Stylosanthes scabra]|uniref:Uncharacterized protein n=1 Tax=Stylosanthes scabra TaxID=79078 RepID=A0ABU6ZP33_9FABA|nr:hypothetical protein [Stylosanthes scabra]